MWMLLLTDETVEWVEAEDVRSQPPFLVLTSWTTVINRPREVVARRVERAHVVALVPV